LSDRILSFLLYVILTLAVLWGGVKAIDYFADYHFYRGFLENWRRGFVEYSASGHPWPQFDGWNHAEYMNNLVGAMGRKIGFRPPEGDQLPYKYHLQKQQEETQKIFLLVRPGRMVIYGLSPTTAKRVDAMVDGHSDLTRGDFTASLTETETSMTATWIF
jgi:hypothetical protein